MDITVVVLAIGLVALAISAVLLWRAQARGAGGHASITIADMFSASLTLTPVDTAQANEAVRTAEAERGTAPANGELPQIGGSTTTFARVLWVDDEPDNNLYETIALEKLGKFVTKATSTEAALDYLDRMDFTILITDLGRHGDRDAGLHLIHQLRANGQRLPIVVYTGDARPVREMLTSAGADAVVDLPGPLIREVESRVSRLGQEVMS